MYEPFFGLQQEPFSIAPDPRFLYMSDKHREALALLHHGITRGAGFVLLTGDIGAGKTTVWRRFLQELPSHFDVASVVNPRLDVTALLGRICDDLRIELPAPGRAVDLIDAVHGHLLLASAQGRRTLVVIDEAQALSMDVLEQLRLLTNLDVDGRKLQVMLIGQPELRQILQRPQLEPLAQRVLARFHLPALSAAETAAYIGHRLAVAGLAGPLPFDADALAAVHRLCQGVPRRINVLCDRALIAAFQAGQHRVDAQTVEQAAAAIFGAPPPAAAAPVQLPDQPEQLAQRVMAPAAPAAPAAHAGLQPPPAAGNGGRGWAGVAGVALVGVAAGVLLAPRWMAALAPTAQPVPAAQQAQQGQQVQQGQQPLAPRPALPTVVLPAPSIEAAFNGTAADDAQAWQALGALWGATLGPGEPCAAAAQQQLQCFRSRGGLAPIRQLGRPGVLKLVDERGRAAQVLLTGLSDDSAMLTIAGVERPVPLAHLARLWRGEFATFWRAPRGYTEADGGGPALGGWLAQRLSGLDGQSAADIGDGPLRARIFTFQLAQGLAPDGVAGPLTLMQLNRASGVDEPRLRSGGATTAATATATTATATTGSRPF